MNALRILALVSGSNHKLSDMVEEITIRQARVTARFYLSLVPQKLFQFPAKDYHTLCVQ
jgi:hypothetical protein